MLTLTFHELLSKNVAANPERIAVVDGDTELTYLQVHTQVEKLAGWLWKHGVRRGHRVCVHLQKSVPEIVATFAIARLGAVFVNLSAQRTVQQLAHTLGDSGSRIAFVDPRRAQELVRAGLVGDLERVVVTGEPPAHERFCSWSSAEADPAPEVRCIDADLAALLYTSGSTGRPRGVMLSHLNIILGARVVSRYLENTAEDRILSLLPLGFDYGLNQLTTAFLVGARVVLQKVPLPVEIVKTVLAAGVTGLGALPPIWIPLVHYLHTERKTIPSLRYLTNSGGAIPPSTLDVLPAVFPAAKIFLMYGLTEAFRSTYLPPERFADKKGSIGLAMPDVEVFIVDAEGHICGPGEQGELVHRGSLISGGYWGLPDVTAAKIRSCPALAPLIGDEKVCYSGDLVRIDEDGFLWFVSRIDALIKCNGVRVSPTEVEEVLYGSGQVADAVAFGVPDDALGQAVHVAVAVLDGQTLDEAKLRSHCRAQLPGYMVPHTFHSWPGAMPRNANGKLDRPAIVASFITRGPGFPEET